MKQQDLEKEARVNFELELKAIDLSTTTDGKYYISYDTEIRWNSYLAACKKRDEEQRLKNEKALEAMAYIEKLLPYRYQRDFDKELETIKAALESV